MIYTAIGNHLKSKGITHREVDFIMAVKEGKMNQQIADEQFVELKTVKFHLTKIFKKLGVKNRLALSAYMAELEKRHGYIVR